MAGIDPLLTTGRDVHGLHRIFAGEPVARERPLEVNGPDGVPLVDGYCWVEVCQGPSIAELENV